MIHKVRILFFFLLVTMRVSYAQINPYEFDKVLESIETVEDIPPYLSIEDLWLLRNYIFAKEQYKFKNEGLKEFYELHYDLVGIRDNVSDRFTDRENKIINELKRREQILREEKTYDVILDHQFSLQNGVLVMNGDNAYRILDKRARYIDTRQLGPELYSIQIESNYRIDIIGCCGTIGVTNDVVKQFLFYKSSGVLVEVPDQITIGKTIDQVIGDKYIFVLNDIFSGAHDLEIYDLTTFELLARVQQIESVTYIDSEYIEIWRFTDQEAAYPYKYVRQYKFENGALKDMKVEQKVNAEWYFAG